MTRTAIWITSLVLAGASASVAAAQSAPSSAASTPVASADGGFSSASPTDLGDFARNRNVSVRERARPGYEAVGIHSGQFFIYPRLSLDGQYNDNVYATQINKVSDWIFHISPEVAIRSNWSRHELALFARARFNEYANHSTENTTDYSVGATGRLDVLRTSNLFAGATYDRATEPRTSPNAPTAAASPIVYDLVRANIGGVHEMNRIRLFGRVDYSGFNYHNNTTISGAPLIQNDRDYHEWDENGRIEYAMSPEMSFYVSGTLNQRTYRQHPPTTQFNRDSDGYNIAGGTSFDITRLIRGDIQAGYMHQSYSDNRFGDTSGLFFTGRVDWFPTELTTVNLSASRSIQEPAEVAASGYISTTAAVQVDHEFLRNLLASATASYTNNNYEEADRRDKLVSAGVSATYLVNSRVGVRLAYDYQKLDSHGTARTLSYNNNRITGSVTLQY